MGFRQFSPYILAFQEKANTVRTSEMLCIGQKPRQGRTGPGGDSIKGYQRDVFHPLITDGHRKLHALCCGLEEIAFLGGRLEQSHSGSVSEHFRQNQPGEPGSGTQIRDRPGVGRDEGHQLGRIQKVAPP